MHTLVSGLRRRLGFCTSLCDPRCCEPKKSRATQAGQSDELFGDCGWRRRFDSSKSRSYQPNGTHFVDLFGDSDADGFAGVDTLRVGKPVFIPFLLDLLVRVGENSGSDAGCFLEESDSLQITESAWSCRSFSRARRRCHQCKSSRKSPLAAAGNFYILNFVLFGHSL